MKMPESSRGRLSRRSFLHSSGLITLAFGSLQRLLTSAPLRETDDTVLSLRSDFYETLDLPRDFSYSIFSEAGETMSDGLLVPGRHDGMAAFPGRNGRTDRKSTRLNSSHSQISYAVFCLKKK